MEPIAILGRSLKDDLIIDILEWGEAKVVYDFDRSHENIPDVYWAACKSKGLCLRFDEAQKLDVCFFYILPIEGYEPVLQENIFGIEFWSNLEDVKKSAHKTGLKHTTSERHASPSLTSTWIRLEYDKYHVHYEFRQGELSMVTVMAVDLS